MIITVIAIASGFKTQTNYEYLRIHIRANSNELIDQNVKYKIKDDIVDYLVPFLANCNDKQTAQKIVLQNLAQIEKIADRVLQENSMTYTSNAKINNEYFPTRVYEDLVLESGNYDALIVELGKAEGDNWWCVVYPPFCFVSSNTKLVYKSKILEIIESFKNKGN